MSWFVPHSVEAGQQRLDAILAENVSATDQAKASAEEIKESVEAEHQALAMAIEDTHRRRLQREKRAREKAKRDPGLSAVNDVLKLLEGRN
jgi:hypothetical protein